MSGKRLYRSRDDRMIAGVCGGLAEYFNIDPTIVRLVLLFLTLWGGGGVLVYVLAWIVIPERPASAKAPAAKESKQVEEKPAPQELAAEVVDEPEETAAPEKAASVEAEPATEETSETE